MTAAVVVVREDDEPTVFELNSEGVYRLQQGKYVEAAAKFVKALTMLRTIEAQDVPAFRLKRSTGYGSQADNEVINDISLITAPLDCGEIVLTPPGEQQGRACNDDSPPTSNTEMELFSMAVATIYLNYEGTRGLRLTWSFLLYNLGLCHHHREVSGLRTMDSTALRYALDCYQSALRVLEGHFDDGEPQDVALLLLAIFNNMAHIYSHFCSVAEVRHCTCWMHHLLASPSSARYAARQRDIAFFQLVLATIPGNAFSKAPAA